MRFTDILPARNQSHWQPAKVRFDPREPKSLITFDFAFKIQAEGLADYTPPALNRQGLETPVGFKLLIDWIENKFVARIVPSIKKADIILGGDHLEGIELIFRK